MLALAAVLAGIALGSATALAQSDEFTGAPEPPDLIELVGHLGRPAANETGGWDITLGAGLSPTVYDFHLSGMRILNSGRLPLSVLSSLEPYRPTFFVFASPEQLAQLAAATGQDTLVVMGYRRRGSRNLMVTELRVAPPATPAATPLGIE
jgi:hypothetical protein